jgi:hypothetical protein
LPLRAKVKSQRTNPKSLPRRGLQRFLLPEVPFPQRCLKSNFGAGLSASLKTVWTFDQKCSNKCKTHLWSQKLLISSCCLK